MTKGNWLAVLLMIFIGITYADLTHWVTTPTEHNRFLVVMDVMMDAVLLAAIVKYSGRDDGPDAHA